MRARRVTIRAAGSVLVGAAPRKAASVTAQFAEKNAALIGVAIGIAVFAACEAVTVTAGGGAADLRDR